MKWGKRANGGFGGAKPFQANTCEALEAQKKRGGKDPKKEKKVNTGGGPLGNHKESGRKKFGLEELRLSWSLLGGEETLARGKGL